MTGSTESWWLLAMISSALISFLAVYLVIFLANSSGLIAMPGERQSHSSPTPTGGGLGITAALLVVSLLPGFREQLPEIWISTFLPGLLILTVVGWLDDLKPMSATLRIVIQLAVSLWLLLCLRELAAESGLSSSWMLSNWALFPVAVLLTGIMNAYNFMDGSHGMAGFEGFFAAFVLGCLFAYAGEAAAALAAFTVAGATLGFLPWNFPRPRIFMGDAGSVTLGFILGGLIMVAVALEAIATPVALLVLSVFIVDAGLTLALRVLRGERWYTAHRQHVYQRLIISGWSHNRVLTLYQVVNLLLVVPGIVLGTLHPEWAWAATGMIVIVMALAWTVTSLKLGAVS